MKSVLCCVFLMLSILPFSTIIWFSGVIISISRMASVGGIYNGMVIANSLLALMSSLMLYYPFVINYKNRMEKDEKTTIKLVALASYNILWISTVIGIILLTTHGKDPLLSGGIVYAFIFSISTCPYVINELIMEDKMQTLELPHNDGGGGYLPPEFTRMEDA